MSRKNFDTAKAIATAWTFLLAEGEPYITATDLERQVRQYAQDQMDGKPWGASGRGWGMTVVRISGNGNLLMACRDWLFREERAGRIEGFNFGRGHVSGMRFRPMGSGPSEAEKRTMEAKERRRTTPRPVHYSSVYYGRIECTKDRKRAMYRGESGHGPRRTTKPAEVTCKRCANLLGDVCVTDAMQEVSVNG